MGIAHFLLLKIKRATGGKSYHCQNTGGDQHKKTFIRHTERESFGDE